MSSASTKLLECLKCIFDKASKANKIDGNVISFNRLRPVIMNVLESGWDDKLDEVGADFPAAKGEARMNYLRDFVYYDLAMYHAVLFERDGSARKDAGLGAPLPTNMTGEFAPLHVRKARVALDNKENRLRLHPVLCELDLLRAIEYACARDVMFMTYLNDGSIHKYPSPTRRKQRINKLEVAMKGYRKTAREKISAQSAASALATPVKGNKTQPKAQQPAAGKSPAAKLTAAAATPSKARAAPPKAAPAAEPSDSEDDGNAEDAGEGEDDGAGAAAYALPRDAALEPSFFAASPLHTLSQARVLLKQAAGIKAPSGNAASRSSVITQLFNQFNGSSIRGKLGAAAASEDDVARAIRDPGQASAAALAAATNALKQLVDAGEGERREALEKQLQAVWDEARARCDALARACEITSKVFEELMADVDSLKVTPASAGARGGSGAGAKRAAAKAKLPQPKQKKAKGK